MNTLTTSSRVSMRSNSKFEIRIFTERHVVLGLSVFVEPRFCRKRLLNLVSFAYYYSPKS